MGSLSSIDTPADLRALAPEQLPSLADELRTFVLDTVSRVGGHLSSNLGTIELTIALHYVFDTPDDRIVWDVGHQSYAHKILTSRRDKLHSLRQLGGLSGFARRDESEHDPFGAGHSSTSISAALGMALAARTMEHSRWTVAVIGDGAMSAGMAFEALNNVGVHDDIRLLVILNDNDMSISSAVGALSRYLRKLSAERYRAAAPGDARNARATMFDELGLPYTGPIDGHDLDALVFALQSLKRSKGPQFLHVATTKGHGYARAVADPVLYHGTGKFDPSEGIKPAVPSPSPSKPTYSQVFGNWLCDTAASEKRLVAITPAMCEGSGMAQFAQRFPQRYHDVGIAEQHAVTFAAGLACEGMKPVVAIYSTFLQRAYDQLIHDVALQNLDVTFAVDRAGLVGPDGATHSGAYDLAFLRCIPNLVVATPSDESECRRLLTSAFLHPGPAAVRYPRGTSVGAAAGRELAALPIGKGEIRRNGQALAILAFGSMVAPSLDAAERLDATVADMRFVKPLDVELILELARTHRALITVEEGVVMGGAGAAVAEALAAAGIVKPVLHLGLPDRFIEHGETAQLLAQQGLDANGIAASIAQRFATDDRTLALAN